MSPTLATGLSPVRETLGNGASVIVQETSTTPSVSINARFQAGSLYEPPDISGLAYLTARVIDRGTSRRTADEIAEDLDRHGVSLRIGTTRHSMTFSTTCLADDFDLMLDLMVDVARRPVFPEVEVAKRRAESITALGQDEDNPAVRAVQVLSEMLYGADHPYGRPAKGTAYDIGRLDREALVRFHSEHVRPAALSLVIVGDVDTSTTFGRARSLLEDWTGDPERPVVVPRPAMDAIRRVRRIPMAGKSQADIAYGFTSISRFDPRYYSYWVLNNILGQFGLGGRLADNIRERQGMAYYAFSAFDATVGDSPLVIRAGVDPRNVDRTIDAIDAEVRELGLHGPTSAEMDESRAYLIGSIPRLLETNYSIAGFLQDCEQFGLGLDFDQRLPRLLEAVTIDEVIAAAAEVLHPERAAIAIAGPELPAGGRE